MMNVMDEVNGEDDDDDDDDDDDGEYTFFHQRGWSLHLKEICKN